MEGETTLGRIPAWTGGTTVRVSLRPDKQARVAPVKLVATFMLFTKEGELMGNATASTAVTMRVPSR
jgi:hypothetical protein